MFWPEKDTFALRYTMYAVKVDIFPLCIFAVVHIYEIFENNTYHAKITFIIVHPSPVIVET